MNDKNDKQQEQQATIETTNQRERQPRRPPEDQQQHQPVHRIVIINDNDHFVDQNRNLNLSDDEQKIQNMNSNEPIESNDKTSRDSRRHHHSDSPISTISCTTSGSESSRSGACTSTDSTQQQQQQQQVVASKQNGKQAKSIKFVHHDGDEHNNNNNNNNDHLDEFSRKLARDCSQDDDSIRINMLDMDDEHFGQEDHDDHRHLRKQSADSHCELVRLIADKTTTERQTTTTTITTTKSKDDLHRRDEDSFELEKIIIGSELIDHHRQEQPQPASKDLVGQLGRRMSLLPQLLARRASKHDHHHQQRLSLQDQSSFPASNLPEPAQPLTVAGVGGTITTVTRSKRKTAPLPRLVAKNGTVNLFLNNIDRSQYVRDLFTTMIDIKWRYNLMAAAFGFVFSWLLFACIWYCVLYVHNDLEHENDPSWSPCIVNVYSFPAALLFSIETQSTLGFGSRIISVECPGAIVIFCTQLIFGVVVECLIVGMVFAKLSRPAKRSQTIMYSKFATICLRQGKMCLMFRVGDVRSKSHIIGATIRASLVSQKITEEGETIPFYHHQLKVKIDDSQNSLLLIWPLTIVHLIDESSPFYELNSEQLANFKFEIITVLEGTVESTGQAIQVRSSYLPSEVKWGYRFEPIVSTHGIGKYAQTIIDYNKFNRVIRVETPNCSPKEFYSRRVSSPADIQSRRLAGKDTSEQLTEQQEEEEEES